MRGGQLRGGLVDPAQPTRRQRLGHRQLHEHRADAVTEPRAVRGVTHVDRHHRPRPARWQRFAALDQQAPEPAGAGGEDDIVDGRTEPPADLLQVG